MDSAVGTAIGLLESGMKGASANRKDIGTILASRDSAMSGTKEARTDQPTTLDTTYGAK